MLGDSSAVGVSLRQVFQSWSLAKTLSKWFATGWIYGFTVSQANGSPIVIMDYPEEDNTATTDATTAAATADATAATATQW